MPRYSKCYRIVCDRVSWQLHFFRSEFRQLFDGRLQEGRKVASNSLPFVQYIHLRGGKKFTLWWEKSLLCSSSFSKELPVLDRLHSVWRWCFYSKNTFLVASVFLHHFLPFACQSVTLPVLICSNFYCFASRASSRRKSEAPDFVLSSTVSRTCFSCVSSFVTYLSPKLIKWFRVTTPSG